MTTRPARHLTRTAEPPESDLPVWAYLLIFVGTAFTWLIALPWLMELAVR